VTARREPRRDFIEREGLRIGFLDWGGDGTPLVFLHPTGLCAGFFDPLARRLTNEHRCIAVDLRAHGPSDTPPAREGYAYVEHAADVLAVFDALGITTADGLGVSLGGGVLVALDHVRPRVLRRILLCEAIVFPHMGPSNRDNPMSVVARKRRRTFPSRDAMRASYRTKPVFAVLAPEALEAYIEYGTVVHDDGTVTLACDPDDEAETFEMASSEFGAPAAWGFLPDLSCEVVVAAGNKSDLPLDRFKEQAARAGADFHEVDGGHFFLQEDTDRAEHLVRTWLAGGV
jgi:pimeloyl-ACP methyl ester carboxylesterase